MRVLHTACKKQEIKSISKVQYSEFRIMAKRIIIILLLLPCLCIFIAGMPTVK